MVTMLGLAGHVVSGVVFSSAVVAGEHSQTAQNQTGKAEFQKNVIY